MWWNTFYNTSEVIVEPPIVEKPSCPEIKPGITEVLVIDELKVNIEVIKVKLNIEIEPMVTDMDIVLKLEPNELKIDMECL